MFLTHFRAFTKVGSKPTDTQPNCKVEFNQPSSWLYSVPNLLVFQHLVTLYLGGLVVRVVSDMSEVCSRVCKKTETRGCMPSNAAHVPSMLEVELSC